MFVCICMYMCKEIKAGMITVCCNKISCSFWTCINIFNKGRLTYNYLFSDHSKLQRLRTPAPNYRACVNKIWARGNPPGFTTDGTDTAVGTPPIFPLISFCWVPIDLGVLCHLAGSHVFLPTPSWLGHLPFHIDFLPGGHAVLSQKRTPFGEWMQWIAAAPEWWLLPEQCPMTSIMDR